MSDTQWPRYEVFKQDKANKVHEAIGSVHASDDQMALLNARDVFVRRPSAVSLWVVPAEEILTVTAEELATAEPGDLLLMEDEGEQERFVVCNRRTQRRSMVAVSYVGEVTAGSKEEALRLALADEAFGGADVWVWWVFPQAAVTASEEDDVASMFAPALDKTYRQQSAYGFVGPRRGQQRRSTAVDER